MKKMCSYQQGSDRISFLPDEIQSQILCFLPLEKAIKTSILSTRWRQTYRSLSELEFIQTEFHSKSDLGFIEVIDQVLRAHYDSSIDYLGLSFDVDDAPAATPLQMNEWISIAVNHHVQELFFEASLSSPYTLPHSLVTCSSLIGLELSNIHINFQTTPLCFPRLEILFLLSCQLTDANFTTSNCPMLKSLEIRDPIDHSKISLSLPSLTDFYYDGKDPPNISLETLVSLEHARFWISSRDHSYNWDLVRKMLKGLDKVRKLELCYFYVECLRINMAHFRLDYPAAAFSSLKVLDIYYSNKSQVTVLKFILNSSPNLQDLRLGYYKQRLRVDHNNILTYWEEKGKNTSPTGDILNKLRQVQLQYLKKEIEFELMKYLVENAAELKELNISGSQKEGIEEENVKNIYEKLKLFSQRRTSPFEYTIFASIEGAEPERVEWGMMPSLNLDFENC